MKIISLLLVLVALNGLGANKIVVLFVDEECLESCWECQDDEDNCLWAFDSTQAEDFDTFDCDQACSHDEDGEVCIGVGKVCDEVGVDVCCGANNECMWVEVGPFVFSKECRSCSNCDEILNSNCYGADGICADDYECLYSCWECQDNEDDCLWAFDSTQAGDFDTFDCDQACSDDTKTTEQQFEMETTEFPLDVNVCANHTQAECNNDMYCAWWDFPNLGYLGCYEEFMICLSDWDPVCGVDGNTYSNFCDAFNERVEVECEEECPCTAFTGAVCGARENGYCVTDTGADQNEGVIFADGSEYWSVEQCLDWCKSESSVITGCEYIWDQYNRGCYKHTHDVAYGNDAANHYCWICTASVDPSTCEFSNGCEKCATVAYDLGLNSTGDACWNCECGDKWGTQCGCVHCEEEVYNYCNSSNSEANDVSEISSSDDFVDSGEEDLSSGEEESFSSSEKDDFSSEEKALEEESGYTDAIAGGVVGFLCLCAVFMWYGYVRTHPKEGLCPCCGGSKKSQGGGNMQMA